MKSRQLANVLIKILGLYAMIHGLPGVTNLVYICSINGGLIAAGGSGYPSQYMFAQVAAASPTAAGVFLIMMSQSIAAFLFKEDEP
jgi:hypothetical protein